MEKGEIIYVYMGNSCERNQSCGKQTIVNKDINIYRQYIEKVTGGPQTKKEKKKHCLWGAPPVLLFDQVDQTTGTKTEVVWLLRQMDL